MKLANLVESNLDLDKDVISEITNICKKIKNECSKAAKLFVNGTVLVRGYSNTDKITMFKPRRDTKRIPKDVNKHVDSFIEYYRAKYIPKIASRQHAIFCFSSSIENINSSDANEYGNMYLLFPRDNSKIFQSKTVEDFFASELYQEIVEVNNKYEDINDFDIRISEIDYNEGLEKLIVNNYLDVRSKLNNYFMNSIRNISDLTGISLNNYEHEVVIEGDCYLINYDIFEYGVTRKELIELLKKLLS